MRRQRLGLFGILLALNLTLIIGALFSENAVTIAAVFAIDALVGIGRILYERLAGANPSSAAPAMFPYWWFEPLYEMVADKQESFRIASRLPPIYPRNLPYVIDHHVIFVVLAAIVVYTWSALEPFEDGLGLTLLPEVLLVGLKHDRIVQLWSATGRYANASARTIRGSRELVYTTIIACVAVWWLARTLPTPAYVTASTILLCLPKFAFECRECGFGLWPLTFDSSGGTTAETLTVPDGPPRQVYRNDRRAVRAWALHDGLSYALLVAFSLAGFLGTVGLYVYGTLSATYWGVGLALFASPLLVVPISFVVVWLAYANEEYRVYDETLVGYDTLLEEPQWVISTDDISAISVGDYPLGWTILGRVNVLPFSKYPVVLERRQADTLCLRALKDPTDLVRSLRGTNSHR